jgi:hypothetical protein
MAGGKQAHGAEATENVPHTTECAVSVALELRSRCPENGVLCSAGHAQNMKVVGGRMCANLSKDHEQNRKWDSKPHAGASMSRISVHIDNSISLQATGYP